MVVCRLMALFFDLKCGEQPEWEVCTVELDCSRAVMQLCADLEVCGSIPDQGNYFELRFFWKVGSYSDIVMPLGSLCATPPPPPP